ncbi:MAG TPA: phosphotransferase [Candidatus Nanopelagicales bacterium]|nr:phosphotransferase [Candidatus Nanopelagicales bacterium]
MVIADEPLPRDVVLDDSLAAPFTRLGEAGVAALLREGWGLSPDSLSRLDTERDDSFVVDTGERRFVLKVAHPLDDPAVLDLQCAALAHVANRDPELPVPHVLPDVDGALLRRLDGSEPRLARLLSHLPGRILDYSTTSASDRRAIGAAVARLSLALSDFEHPGADRSLPWDLQQVGALRPLLEHVTDATARADAATVLDRYDAAVGGALAGTRQQVVHNDVNPDNVLLDPGAPDPVRGILDFGDMLRTAVVADLAVAMAYAVDAAGPGGDPWTAPYELASGYVEVRALLPDEEALLADLVRTRLAQRQLVNSWLAAADPANAHYTGRSLARSAVALHRVVTTPAPGERG